MRGVLYLAAVLLWLGGCVPVPVPTSANISIDRSGSIEPGEAKLAVVAKVPFDKDYVMACVKDALANKFTEMDILDHWQMRNSFFPWLEPDQAKKTVNLARWLRDDPKMRERMSNLGISHVLTIDAAPPLTQTGSIASELIAVAAYGGGFSETWRAELVAAESGLLLASYRFEEVGHAGVARVGFYGAAFIPVKSDAKCRLLARALAGEPIPSAGTDDRKE